jgi:hypothetical protein
VTELNKCSRGPITLTELMESLAKFIKHDVLYRCSDGSAPWDSISHYERENVQTVIGTSGATVPPRLRRLPRRRASAATTRRSELSSTALAERKKQVRFAVEAPASPDVDERLRSCTGVRHGLYPGALTREDEAWIVKRLAKKLGRPRPRLADGKLHHWAWASCKLKVEATFSFVIITCTEF